MAVEDGIYLPVEGDSEDGVKTALLADAQPGEVGYARIGGDYGPVGIRRLKTDRGGGDLWDVFPTIKGMGDNGATFRALLGISQPNQGVDTDDSPTFAGITLSGLAGGGNVLVGAGNDGQLVAIQPSPVIAAVRAIWSGGESVTIGADDWHDDLDILTARGNGGPLVPWNWLSGSSEKITFYLPFTYKQPEDQSFTLTVKGNDGTSDFIFYQKSFTATGGTPTDRGVLEIVVTSGYGGNIYSTARWNSTSHANDYRSGSLGPPTGAVTLSASIYWDAQDEDPTSSYFLLDPWHIQYAPAAIELP